MMQIQELRLQNFRKFRDPVRLIGFSSGLNVFFGANETGKSTLFAAIHAVLFERFSSRSENIRLFSPYNSAASPCISLSFHLHGKSWLLEKRFLHREPVASLKGGEDVWEGESVEEKLQHLLRFSPSQKHGIKPELMGVWSSLWVPQGRPTEQLSFKGDIAKSTMADCLDKEMGVLSGTVLGSRILRSVQTQRSVYSDGRGHPKGRYKQVIQEIEDGIRSLGVLKERQERLSNDVIFLTQQETLLLELQNVDWFQEQQVLLQRLREEYRESLAFSTRHRLAEAEWKVASNTLEEFKREKEELLGFQRSFLKVQQSLEEVNKSLFALPDHDLISNEDFLAAQQALETSEERYRFAQEHIEKYHAYLQSEEKLRCAQEISSSLQQEQKILIKNPMDQQSVDRARNIFKEIEILERTLSVQPQISVNVSSAMKTTINGVECSPGYHRFPSIGSTTIVAPGIEIVFDSHSTDGKKLLECLEKAKFELKNLCRILGCDTLEDLEHSWSLYQKRIERIQDLQKALQSLAPDGIAFLIETVRDLCVSPPSVALTFFLENRKMAEENLRNMSHALFQSLEISEKRSRFHAERSVLEKESHDLKLSVDRAVLRLPVLEELMSRTILVEKRLRCNLEEMEHVSINSPEILGIEIQRCESLIRDREIRISNLRETIAGCKARIVQEGANGLEEMIALQERSIQKSKEEKESYVLDIQALELLHTTLLNCSKNFERSYLRPVTNRIQPYIEELFPGSSLETDEGFQIQSLCRGNLEAFHRLSLGTQEQLSVLVRLAAAEMLVDGGIPAMVMLDDAFAYTDTFRLERLKNILHKASQKVQILLFTCRSDLKEVLGGTALRLEWDKNNE